MSSRNLAHVAPVLGTHGLQVGVAGPDPLPEPRALPADHPVSVDVHGERVRWVLLAAGPLPAGAIVALDVPATRRVGDRWSSPAPIPRLVHIVGLESLVGGAVPLVGAAAT